MVFQLLNPHKWVDAYIFENCQKIDAIIIAPTTIYAIGSGPFSKISQQIPTLITKFLEFGSAATVGKGINLWNDVHIEDLAELYILILTKALEGKADTGPEWWILFWCRWRT